MEAAADRVCYIAFVATPLNVSRIIIELDIFLYEIKALFL